MFCFDYLLGPINHPKDAVYILLSWVWCWIWNNVMVSV